MYNATISKTFKFSAAHQLLHLPESHKCRRLHGHNYAVDVFVTGPLIEDSGMVMDYDDLSTWIKPLISLLDHRFLSSGVEPILSVLPDTDIVNIGAPTTAENLALVVGLWLIDHQPTNISGFSLRVIVHETDKTSAECSLQFEGENPDPVDEEGVF